MEADARGLSRPVTLREAGPADAAQLARLHVATVTVAYRDIFPSDAPPPSVQQLTSGYAASLARDDHVLFVAATDASPGLIGSIALVGDPSVPAGWRLQTFNVLPEHQGAGVGRRLYDRALDAADERDLSVLNLWVLEGNDRARSIYEAWGWRLVAGEVYVNEPSGVLDVLYELDLDAVDRVTS